MSRFRPRFFLSQAPTEAGASGFEVALGAEDSHHARAVLRLQLGDECEVVAGAAVYAATVSVIGDPVRVRLTARLESSAEGAVYGVEVGLVQALGRPAVMDYVFEKGTEVGVSFFFLVKAAGSPAWADSPSADRLDRWARIAREAAKQSKQVAVPRVLFLGGVSQALHHAALAGTTSLVLDPEAPESLDEVVTRTWTAVPRPGAFALWVGPEGGWTDEEARLFEGARVVASRLGRGVLRTETAGPVAIAVARLALRDW